jgi:hypothetical protein
MFGSHLALNGVRKQHHSLLFDVALLARTPPASAIVPGPKYRVLDTEGLAMSCDTMEGLVIGWENLSGKIATQSR